MTVANEMKFRENVCINTLYFYVKFQICGFMLLYVKTRVGNKKK